jgi:hypothetical protein
MAKRTGGFIGQDGINAPDQATGVTGTAGDEQVDVSFTSPSDVGGAAITGYRVQSNDGIGASGSASPITVTGLTNGTSYTFNVWAINPFGWSSPSDASGAVSPAAPIGLFIGGKSPASGFPTIADYEKIVITTTGNGVDYGDLTADRRCAGALSNATRTLFVAGQNSSGTAVNNIEYINPLVGGTAVDFGDLASSSSAAQYIHSCLSNSTRGCIYPAVTGNTIEYVTIGSTGNSTDFGDQSVARKATGTLASPTRGICINGDGASRSNVIDYITIASAGNATDFGDSIQASYGVNGLSNSTRGVYSLGNNGDAPTGACNVLNYITVASTGNSTDFGDLTQVKLYGNGSDAASSTRGVFSRDDGTAVAQLEYITISTTGNASSFGNLTTMWGVGLNGCSNAHGGLS